MTSVRRKDDLNVDLEQQFVLRMPQRAAENLRKDLSEGLMNVKDKLSLEIHPEKRRGKVIYDGQMYHAKLVDLPCIVESYKTIDKKNFYKTADISQMLICKDEFGTESPDEEEEGSKKKDKEKKYVWNHGLCLPLKNVRKRRFRKTLQKKNPELPDIERELRRLFTMDSQATSFKYEVIYETDTKANTSKDKKNATKNTSSMNPPLVSNQSLKSEKPSKIPRVEDDTMDDTMDGDEINPLAIFGPCSSSEGEDGASDNESKTTSTKNSKNVTQSAFDFDDENSRTANADDDL